MAGIIQKGRYGKYLHIILTVIDFVIINLALLATSIIEPSLYEMRTRTVWLLANLTYIPVAYWLNKIHKSRAIQMDHVIANAFRGVAAHAVLFISSLYFVGIDHLPWTAFAIFYGICFLAFPLWWTLSRLIIKAYRRHGGNFAKVVIVGANPTGLHLIDEMNTDCGFGYRVVGLYDDKPECDIPGGIYRGALDHLEEYLRNSGETVDEIYYTLSGNDEKTMKRVVGLADNYMVQFCYVPNLNAYFNRGFELTALGSMPLLSIRSNPLKGVVNRTIKRSVDIFVSASLILLSPIVLIPVAIAIKISSPGPIFFRQKRTGYRGSEFECLKFRTMKVNTEADSVQATENDPRKTRVGNFLRHTSIDELPQVWNVLIGDMSLVGPRPHMLAHTDLYSRLIEKYMVRHLVRPGITGWAQVNGYRGATRELWQMEKRVKYDVWYIEHWNLLLDFKIMLRTVYNAIRGEKNAF